MRKKIIQCRNQIKDLIKRLGWCDTDKLKFRNDKINLTETLKKFQKEIIVLFQGLI